MGAADRRSARSHRTELGEGVDHRGQPNPRRQVLGHLIGKEGFYRPQRRDVRRDKPGYRYQPLESVFAARQSAGTGARRLAPHPRHTIYDCGQAGIVGHLGCAFSTIEDNHIYNIALKREFYGYEIAGIKLHAAIDVTIRHNRIHHCTLGTWPRLAGPKALGCRETCSTTTVAVCSSRLAHGPYLVEHNVFASPASLELFSQGALAVSRAAASGAVVCDRRCALGALSDRRGDGRRVTRCISLTRRAATWESSCCTPPYGRARPARFVREPRRHREPAPNPASSPALAGMSTAILYLGALAAPGHIPFAWRTRWHSRQRSRLRSWGASPGWPDPLPELLRFGLGDYLDSPCSARHSPSRPGPSPCKA